VSADADAAAASAAAALVSENNAAASEAAASTSETNAASSASSASSSASAASTSATNASNSATAAASSATTAGTSATNAASSATAAASSATAAASSATAAAGSATSAASAQTAAEAARDQTLAAFDSFDDRYLGTKTSDPTLDNDGNALVAGALYFNSTDGIMKVYTGSAWVAAYASLSGALLVSNNLSDLGNVATARTNLGLGTAATTDSTAYATAAQGSLADSAVQPGDNVSTLTNDAGYLTSFTESDPVFAASEAAGITSTDTTNWDTAYGWGDHASAGYLTSFTETDPVFSAAPAAGITSTQVTNWDTAYGWGNHASAGYLTTETDPVFSASEAASITSTDTTNWDTAYSWGNHASVGYLTSETYTGTVTSVDMSVPTGLTVSGNPVTSSGTLAVSYATGYSIPTNVSQGNWNDAYSFVTAFPSQTGNSGKYLTTDGSSLSFATVDADPAGTAVALAIALG
jgi:hypothetical protein